MGPTEIRIAARRDGEDHLIDVVSMEYNVMRNDWWIRTTENLRVPNHFPWVVVMAVGKGNTLEAALRDAAEKHEKAVELRKRQEGIV